MTKNKSKPKMSLITLETSQNPLLDKERFYKYCRKRFRNIGLRKEEFDWLLDFYKKEGLLLPIDRVRGKDHYSTFQIHNIYLLENYRSRCLIPRSEIKHKGKVIKPQVLTWKRILKKANQEIKKELKEFNQFLKLLISIQEVYYPYAKSGSKTIQITGDIEEWQKKKKALNLKRELKHLNLKIDDVVKWYKVFSDTAQELLGIKNGDWMQLWKAVYWRRKDTLGGVVRLGVDYLQWAVMLKRFLEDCLQKEVLDLDEMSNCTPKDVLKIKPNRWQGVYSLRHFRNWGYMDLKPGLSKKLQKILNKIQGVKGKRDKRQVEKEFSEFNQMGFYIDWKDKGIFFDKDRLTIKNYYYDKYKRLFYLSNDFGLDYQPRITVFVEGETEKVIFPKVFKWMYGSLPENYGIEFIAFKGVDQLLSTSKNAEKLRRLINKLDKEEKQAHLSKTKRRELNQLIRDLKNTKIVVSNWSAFLGYNLGKWQIIPFFVSDDEGNIRHFLEAEEPIPFEGKNYDVPPEWRFLWGVDNKNKPFKGNNFELANFSNREIASVCTEILGRKIDEKQIQELRKEEKGIKEIDRQVSDPGVKIEIAKSLFEKLFEDYQANNDKKILERPIFVVINKIMKLANLNHMPVDRISELRNKEIILKKLQQKS
ncbi:MAG: TOPRIM nucleotidyl transferase/hydrolase domain-containing protein [Candidatus Nealsonbacteria bacterium]